jgi:hypothetical protein
VFVDQCTPPCYPNFEQEKHLSRGWLIETWEERTLTPKVEKAKAEVRKILVIAVFFTIGFCIVIVHNRLLVEGSQIQIASYAVPLSGG